MSKETRVLLHTCCGPCATHCVRTLHAEHDVTLFFSNSNISPPEEYDRRRAAARELAAICAVDLIEDPYDHAAWLTYIKGYEQEPERGARCEKCFRFNLGRTARYAAQQGFDLFTTTLTVSPHKSSPTIFRIGEALGAFLAIDFKKKGGFQHSQDLSAAYGLYRQHYCGCEFSGPAASQKNIEV